MEKAENVREILNNLGRAESACHTCQADAIDVMIDAAREIDVALSAMTGAEHLPAPGGEGGVPAARFFFREAREKARALAFLEPDERTESLLENVRAATGEVCAGLSL
jgi:hypothetical protein